MYLQCAGTVFCTWETSGTALLGEEADQARSPGWAGRRGQRGQWSGRLGICPGSSLHFADPYLARMSAEQWESLSSSGVMDSCWDPCEGPGGPWGMAVSPLLRAHRPRREEEAQPEATQTNCRCETRVGVWIGSWGDGRACEGGRT